MSTRRCCPLSLFPLLLKYAFWWSSSSITTKPRGWCGHHVPGSNTRTEISKPQLPSGIRFWKPCSGISGDLACLELATEPSPYSADGCSEAAIPPGRFSAAGLWKATLDGPFTRVPREQWQLLTLCSHFSFVPVSPTVIGLLSQLVLSHTPPS